MCSFCSCFLNRRGHVYGFRLLLVNMSWRDHDATLLSSHHLVVRFYKNSLFLTIGYRMCITLVSHKPSSASQSPYNMKKPDLAIHGGQVPDEGCAGYFHHKLSIGNGKAVSTQAPVCQCAGHLRSIQALEPAPLYLTLHHPSYRSQPRRKRRRVTGE